MVYIFPSFYSPPFFILAIMFIFTALNVEDDDDLDILHDEILIYLIWIFQMI